MVATGQIRCSKCRVKTKSLNEKWVEEGGR